jgi:hypothetical protein
MDGSWTEGGGKIPKIQGRHYRFGAGAVGSALALVGSALTPSVRHWRRRFGTDDRRFGTDDRRFGTDDRRFGAAGARRFGVDACRFGADAVGSARSKALRRHFWIYIGATAVGSAAALSGRCNVLGAAFAALRRAPSRTARAGAEPTASVRNRPR